MRDEKEGPAAPNAEMNRASCDKVDITTKARSLEMRVDRLVMQAGDSHVEATIESVITDVEPAGDVVIHQKVRLEVMRPVLLPAVVWGRRAHDHHEPFVLGCPLLMLVDSDNRRINGAC